MRCPPPDSPHKQGQLPGLGSRLVSSRELASLRRKGPKAAGSAEPSTLSVKNQWDTPSYVLIDGVPVAWVGPGKTLSINALRPGKYAVGFRDFLGQSSEAQRTVSLPAELVIGGKRRPSEPSTNN
jgi:hypothetical protein